jgi:Effector-associated domain 11
MKLTDKIKNLIADGKTLQAVDMLQTFLKEHGSNDNQLLNQAFLLEGQYKDLQKKVQLGLEDATADLNRINYSLLNLCDEAESLAGNEEKKAENEEITEGDKSLSNTIKIFGISVLIVLLIVFGFIYFLGKNDLKTATNSNKATETETLPTLTPKTVSSQNWRALAPVLNVNDRLYGNLKITISSITSESFDAERDRITLTLNDNCVETTTSSCMSNYLTFRLTLAADKVLEPDSDDPFAVQAVKTTREEIVRFIVPKSVKSGMLDIFYVDKPKSKATTKIMR